jgi:GT2 family glycosyltransferase
MQYKVCVVTVTYGDRWKFLSSILMRVLSLPQVCRVVVVNNASDYAIESKIADERIALINNANNEGSAGGYNQGIQFALNNVNADFIWLLDDDNLPYEDALSELLKHWQTINGGNKEKALFCLREDRLAHVNIAKGEPAGRYYLKQDNFLGFSVLRILNNQLYKLRKRLKKETAFLPYTQIPYVPYGGLLMHKQMVEQIGFPKAEYFLYVDDSEYTYRITESGAAIYLVPSAKIQDIDKSQGINYKKQLFRSQLLDLWSFRTYYHVRNRMDFYTRVAVKNKFMFNLNKALYLGFLRLISITSNKKSAYKKLVIAVNDGLNGKLGKAGQEKF